MLRDQLHVYQGSVISGISYIRDRLYQGSVILGIGYIRNQQKHKEFLYETKYNVMLYQTLGATSSRDTKKMADSTASRLGRLLVVSSLCLTYKQNNYCAHHVLHLHTSNVGIIQEKGINESQHSLDHNQTDNAVIFIYMQFYGMIENMDK